MRAQRAPLRIVSLAVVMVLTTSTGELARPTRTDAARDIGTSPPAGTTESAGATPPSTVASVPSEPASRPPSTPLASIAVPFASSAPSFPPPSVASAVPSSTAATSRPAAPTQVSPPRSASQPPVGSPTPAAGPPTSPPSKPTASCTVFPASNVWNIDISHRPVRSDSSALLASIGLSKGLHPDFSSTAWNGGLGYGIPWNAVGPSTPRVAVSFTYAAESDPGPYPIPASPRIEGGSDRHLLLWDTSACRLYELFDARRSASGAWSAGSGAIWDLRSNALRPDGWTSADAAGLPILPGLVRYEEVIAGAIRHALRFTAPQTRAAHVYPARHDASSLTGAAYPPMGRRLRLKASFDVSRFGPQVRTILVALQRYGMLLADNGSAWYISGVPDSRWNDDQLHALGQVTGSDLEAVDTGGLVNGS